ncbi:hypothetical protein BKA64DRAFT_255963 [Cadophora sp. MPI-SDFR-AT-0126]|nr:hypothetical protein BKA64DRAFT_255963 [Leotiomycetes sp. MPI-SDFR-AT-0126]
MWKPVGISMLVLFSTTAYFYQLMTTNKTMLPKPNHPCYSHGLEIIDLSDAKPSANPGSPSSVVSSSSVLSLYSGSFFIDHD